MMVFWARWARRLSGITADWTTLSGGGRKPMEEDMARRDALCRLYGIGLILSDAENPKTPASRIALKRRSANPIRST